MRRALGWFLVIAGTAFLLWASAQILSVVLGLPKI